MSCEPAIPRHRTPLGWLLLALLACLVGFYLHVLGLVATPHIDEAYTRAYLTGEFAVYPSSVGWQPGDGLDYTPGTFTDLRGNQTRRNWLARFDWHRVDTPVVTLVGFSGRLFLHLTGEPDAASRDHQSTGAMFHRVYAIRDEIERRAIAGQVRQGRAGHKRLVLGARGGCLRALLRTPATAAGEQETHCPQRDGFRDQTHGGEHEHGGSASMG